MKPGTGGLLMVWETADPGGGPGGIQANLSQHMPKVCSAEFVGFRLPSWMRALMRATHFHPSRAVWHRRSTISPMGFRFRSETARRMILNRPARPAAVMQLFGMFSARVDGAAHVLYLDYTRHLSDADRPPAGYDEWIDLERELYGSADLIFTAGGHVRDDLAGFYGIDPDKVLDVGFGVEDEFFEGVHMHSDGGPPGLLFVCGEAASWRRKGGVEIVEAFGRLRGEVPGCTLDVLGPDGRDSDGIRFLGSVKDRREVARIYRSHDIYVTLPYHEPFGIAYLEAMASGCAVIGSDADAGPRIIEDGVSGRLVSPGDSGTLYTTMRELALDAGLRSRLAAGAIVRARPYRWSVLARRMSDEMAARGIIPG